MATRRPRVKPSAILKPRRVPNAAAVAAAAASEAIASVQAKIEELITDENDIGAALPGVASQPDAVDAGPSNSVHTADTTTSDPAPDEKHHINNRDAVDVKPFGNSSPAHSSFDDRPSIVCDLCTFVSFSSGRADSTQCA